jgi:gas vesicle protein
MENGKGKLSRFGIGLAVGLVIGGVIALLVAPQEGKKTRELLKTKVEEAKKKVDLAVATIKDKLPRVKTMVDKVHLM